MMADIIDEDDIIESTQPETVKETSKDAKSIEDTLKPVQEKSVSNNNEPDNSVNSEDEIPDKYRGKSLKDVIAMHQNAEQYIGKQSGEVGELRKIVDDFILSQSSKEEKSDAKNEEPDFFLDPKAAIKSVVDSDPLRQEMAQELAAQKNQRMANEILGRFPQLKETFESKDFQEWVTKKPHRISLLKRVDNYDVDATEEILGLYGDYTSSRQAAVQDAQAAGKKQTGNALKAANTGNVQQASRPGQTGKPIFRRADIIKLATQDPDRYEQLEDEILAAYAEGRVR